METNERIATLSHITHTPIEKKASSIPLVVGVVFSTHTHTQILMYQPHRRKDTTTTTFPHHSSIASRTDPPNRRRWRRVAVVHNNNNNNDHHHHPFNHPFYYYCCYYYCHPRTIMLPQLVLPLQLRKALRFPLGLLRNPHLIGFVVGILVTLLVQQQPQQPAPSMSLLPPPTTNSKSPLSAVVFESLPHTLRRPNHNHHSWNRGTVRSLRDIPVQESASHPGIFKQSLFDRRSSSIESSPSFLSDTAVIRGISVATIHPGQSIARHVHTTMTELFFVMEGEVDITLYHPNNNNNNSNSDNNSKYETSSHTCAYGCFYTAIPNVPHSFTVRPDAPMDTKLLVIQLIMADDDNDAKNATTTRSAS